MHPRITGFGQNHQLTLTVKRPVGAMVGINTGPARPRPVVPSKPTGLCSRQPSLTDDHNDCNNTPPPLPVRRNSTVQLTEESKEKHQSVKQRENCCWLVEPNTPKGLKMERVSRVGPTFDGRLTVHRSTRPLIDVALGNTFLLGITSTSISSWNLLTGENCCTISTGLDTPTKICLLSPTSNSFVVGTTTGSLLIGTFTTCRSITISRNMSISGKSISHLLVADNELWAIDQEGWVGWWMLDQSGNISADTKVGMSKVLQSISHAVITNDGILWLASGKILEVHQRNKNAYGGLELLARFDYELDMGVTGVGLLKDMAFIANDQLIMGHEDGSIVLWSASNCIPKGVFKISKNRISAAASTKGRYLWVGFTNGAIQIIDTTDWDLLVEFKPHQNAILALKTCAFAGENPFWVPLLSTCSGGGMLCWDALVKNHSMRKLLSMNYKEFSFISKLSVRICSWNVDSQKPPNSPAFWREWLGIELGEVADLVVLGLQEIVDLESASNNARILINANSQSGTTTTRSSNTNDDHPNQVQQWIDAALEFLPEHFVVAQKNMVGLLLVVFLKNSLNANQRHVAIDTVKNGLNGLHGNKGAIAVRLILDDTSICLINCHLAAGQTQVSARDADVANVLKSSAFPRMAQSEGRFMADDGLMIGDCEQIILFGDLNYRINLTREIAEQMMIDADYTALLEHDQCRLNSSNPLHPLRSFMEAPPTFAPTYKYDRGACRLDTSEKHRVPAYCDRILFRSCYKTEAETTSITEYGSVQSMNISDHRPVFATIKTFIKRISPIQRELFKQRILASQWS